MYTLNDWDITVPWTPDSDDVLLNGNRLLTGNGFLGRRGVVDEAPASDMPATIISGLYDQQGNLWREPINAPDPLYTVILADDKPLLAGGEHTLHHEQTLNFRYGIYSRHTSWLINGITITVKAERYAHMENVHLLCMRYTIKTDNPCQIILKQGINRDIKDLNGPHLKAFSAIRCGRILKLCCETQEQNIALAVCSGMVSDSKTHQRGSADDNSGIFNHTIIDLESLKEHEFYIYGTVYHGKDESNNPVQQAQAQAEKAIEQGWDRLLEQHKSEWEKIWRTGDVYIEGDDYARRCLRYSLYHLWIIAPRHSIGAKRSLSIPARGLSGQTYKGAIFWDTEMFMLPYFLTIQPELAAGFIRYRIQTLAGAKRKAQEYGYRGAFFAWESQEDGDDACSDFNVIDVFTGRPVRTYFRDKQIHISADIVYAIKKYIDYTNDYSILAEGAMELILEAARFYLSYLYYSPEKKRYEVLDVIGPDEYHERVNNNAFSNRMISAVFNTALEYINMLNKKDQLSINSLIKRIGFNEDLAFMKTVMNQLYLPRPDEHGIIEQFDGYFRLEDCSLDTVRSRLKDPKEYWGGGTGVASATQIIKQADAVSMLALFGSDYSSVIKKANFDYYEARTEHGSSLSSCMHALLACDIGESDRAYPFFINSAEIDISGASKHFAGLVYIGGTHPAASGGAWMTAVQGFCGFSVSNGKIIIMPRLPKHWRSVKFTAIVNNIEYAITVTGDKYTVCKK